MILLIVIGFSFLLLAIILVICIKKYRNIDLHIDTDNENKPNC